MFVALHFYGISLRNTIEPGATWSQFTEAVDAIIAEAFVSTLVSGTLVRADLDPLVFWFADPAQVQAACGLTNTSRVFQGDWEPRDGWKPLGGRFTSPSLS